MPGKKKIGRKSSRKNTAATSRERSSPEKLSHEDRYQGYDEERTGFSPAHQSDYDVDENNIDQGSDEYKRHGGSR